MKFTTAATRRHNRFEIVADGRRLHRQVPAISEAYVRPCDGGYEGVIRVYHDDEDRVITAEGSTRAAAARAVWAAYGASSAADLMGRQ